jgi:hypothetical protein
LWPASSAILSGVRPSASAIDADAPCFISSRTTSSWPCSQAACSDVLLPVRPSTSIPMPNSILTIPTCPCDAAVYSAMVLPSTDERVRARAALCRGDTDAPAEAAGTLVVDPRLRPRVAVPVARRDGEDEPEYPLRCGTAGASAKRAATPVGLLDRVDAVRSGGGTSSPTKSRRTSSSVLVRVGCAHTDARLREGGVGGGAGAIGERGVRGGVCRARPPMLPSTALGVGVTRGPARGLGPRSARSLRAGLRGSTIGARGDAALSRLILLVACSCERHMSRPWGITILSSCKDRASIRRPASSWCCRRCRAERSGSTTLLDGEPGREAVLASRRSGREAILIPTGAHATPAGIDHVLLDRVVSIVPARHFFCVRFDSVVLRII